MDETGFRTGVGKDQSVITRRNRAHYFGIPENGESTAATEAISASRQFVPAFLILSGQIHMASWCEIPELDADTAIRPTPTGYSNDESSLKWLQHFDKHSGDLKKLEASPDSRWPRLTPHEAVHRVLRCTLYHSLWHASESHARALTSGCSRFSTIEALPRQSAGCYGPRRPCQYNQVLDSQWLQNMNAGQPPE
jgi:hypothetical protein